MNPVFFSAIAAAGPRLDVTRQAEDRQQLDRLEAQQEIDTLEGQMLNSGLPMVNLPLTHRFVPGLYVREILMPAGTLCTSQTHNTEHVYMVLSGRARVYIPGSVGVVELADGHVGVTQPGTRRLLYIVEECRWATCHPLSAEEEEARQGGAGEDELLAAIRERIIERRALPDGSGRTIFDLYQERLREEALAVGLIGEKESACPG